jgi:hypothetical protein
MNDLINNVLQKEAMQNDASYYSQGNAKAASMLL